MQIMAMIRPGVMGGDVPRSVSRPMLNDTPPLLLWRNRQAGRVWRMSRITCVVAFVKCGTCAVVHVVSIDYWRKRRGVRCAVLRGWGRLHGLGAASPAGADHSYRGAASLYVSTVFTVSQIYPPRDYLAPSCHAATT